MTTPDLNSLSGILLNQFPVTGPQQIHHGDVIRLGQVYLHVELLEATGP
ncbi:MAG: FHA domain-containing protein [Hormoscilla sp.]